MRLGSLICSRACASDLFRAWNSELVRDWSGRWLSLRLLSNWQMTLCAMFGGFDKLNHRESLNNLKTLPDTLDAAREIAEKSTFVKEVLGF